MIFESTRRPGLNKTSASTSKCQILPLASVGRLYLMETTMNDSGARVQIVAFPSALPSLDLPNTQSQSLRMASIARIMFSTSSAPGSHVSARIFQEKFTLTQYAMVKCLPSTHSQGDEMLREPTHESSMVRSHCLRESSGLVGLHYVFHLSLRREFEQNI